MFHPIYILTLIVLTFLSMIEFQSNGQRRMIQLYYLCNAFLIFSIGFRYFQGADYPIYLQMYNMIISSVRWNEVFDVFVEPTYVIISKILGSIGLPFYFLTLTFATISVTLKAVTWKKYSPYMFLSLVLYFYSDFFSADNGQFRQATSTACCIFSLKYILKRKNLSYLLCIYIAYLFHKTAIIFLPAYWVANRNFSTLQWGLLLILSFILWPFKIYEVAGNFLGNIAENSSAFSGFNSYNNMEEAQVTPLMEVNQLFFIILILFYDLEISKYSNKNYLVVRNLVLSYYCLFYFFRGNQIYAVRLPTVYYNFIFLLLPMIVFYTKKNKKLLYIFLLIYSWILFFRYGSNIAEMMRFNTFQNVIIDNRITDPAFMPPKSID